MHGLGGGCNNACAYQQFWQLISALPCALPACRAAAVKLVRPDRGGDVLPKGPLDSSTTYGGDFKLFQTVPAKSMKPSNAAKEQLPFNGASTYADSFIPKVCEFVCMGRAAGVGGRRGLMVKQCAAPVPRVLVAGVACSLQLAALAGSLTSVCSPCCCCLPAGGTLRTRQARKRV